MYESWRGVTASDPIQPRLDDGAGSSALTSNAPVPTAMERAASEDSEITNCRKATRIVRKEPADSGIERLRSDSNVGECIRDTILQDGDTNAIERIAMDNPD